MWKIIKDITWKEWLFIVIVSAVISWLAMVPFVDFLVRISTK